MQAIGMVSAHFYSSGADVFQRENFEVTGARQRWALEHVFGFKVVCQASMSI
jgi:hypothetical protein